MPGDERAEDPFALLNWVASNASTSILHPKPEASAPKLDSEDQRIAAFFMSTTVSDITPLLWELHGQEAVPDDVYNDVAARARRLATTGHIMRLGGSLYGKRVDVDGLEDADFDARISECWAAGAGADFHTLSFAVYGSPEVDEARRSRLSDGMERVERAGGLAPDK